MCVPVCAAQVKETTRDVTFLHNELFFAAAQKKYVYIYDKRGLEVHCLREHVDPAVLEFLPHHFLLASVGEQGERAGPGWLLLRSSKYSCCTLPGRLHSSVHCAARFCSDAQSPGFWACKPGRAGQYLRTCKTCPSEQPL